MPGSDRDRIVMKTTALIAALFVTAVAVGTSTAAPTSAHRARTYAPKDCLKPQVEPRRIVFACADVGLYVNHLRWTKWRHRRAKGKGVLHERTCDPACLGSPYKDYPVKIRLRKVKRGTCGGRRVPLFRKAILSFSEKAPPDAHRVRRNPMFCTP